MAKAVGARQKRRGENGAAAVGSGNEMGWGERESESEKKKGKLMRGRYKDKRECDRECDRECVRVRVSGCPLWTSGADVGKTPPLSPKPAASSAVAAEAPL